MKKRILSLLLCLCMNLSLLPGSALAAGETLFERYIPIAQVYSALATPTTAEVGVNFLFQWGTQLVDENYDSAMFAKIIDRKDYPDHFLKIGYLGAFGSLDAATAKSVLGLDDAAYQIAMGAQAPGGNYQKTIDKNSILVTVDLYDADRKWVQNISPACAILAVGPEGEFLTYSQRGGKRCSLFFSMQDDLCKITDDRKNIYSIHFTPTYTWLADKSVAEALLGSKSSAPAQSDYQFIQYPELSQERPQYMTNNILSTTEFIDPFGTYYQVGGGAGLDPEVKNRIENVVDYSEYGRVLSPGETQRSILTADGTLYGVNSLTCEKKVLATGVKQAGKAHYMTADGTVKEIDTGKVVATDCAAFAEHRYAEVIGVLKKDGTLYLGYTYLSEAPGNYEKGLQKMTVDGGKTDQFKAVVACGAATEDNRFFRWKETVTPLGYDEAAFAQGLLIARSDYQLSLELVADKAARVFPYEYFTEEDSTAQDAATGFVVSEEGYVWAFGLHRQFQLSANGNGVKLGMIKHIFPIYQTQGKFGDNANFVAFLAENDNKVKALMANHCTNNKPEAGDLPVGYLSDVPGGYKGVDGYTYCFDMEATKSFTMKPTAFHYLNDKREVFHAMNTSTTPISNMDLLPNVARSSYRADGKSSTVVLLERTDGSMWMTQTYSKVSAADMVAKLGGWENTNAIQITQPTTKVSGRCDYVDLVGGDSSTVVNLGPVDAPSTQPQTTFLADPRYVNVSEYQAEKKYRDGEKFVLLVCSLGCGWCKRLKSGLPATLSAAGYSIYGTSDNTGALNFYWDFVPGSTVGTPYAVIVNGKDDVEVVSAIHSQAEMAAVLQKAKSKGIPSAVAMDQTTPATPTAPTVEAKRPADKLSLSAFEWEVLKLVNQERYKAGLDLLSMPAGLQTACDIRENELATLYDHTRPNGERPSSAIPDSFPQKSAAENIAEGQREPREVMSDWMNSPGHKANILREGMGYLGVGVNTSTPYHWVQLFTVAEIASVTSSSGSLTFSSEEAMQGEYLICTGKDGVESYLPIDVSAMGKSGSGYTVKLAGKTVTLHVGTSAIPATGTAYPSTQTVDLDGKKVTFQMYALKDQDGNPTNYVKVRDLALALNGTKAAFRVDWNGAVSLTAGAAYTPNGSENATPFSGERTYTVPQSPTHVNGSASDLAAIYLVDDAGGGYTYYQLRDLGRKLGFNVDWNAERGVFIETDQPYSGK